LTEQEFRHAVDRAFDDTLRALVPLADREGFDIDRAPAVLRLAFDQPASTTFVVNAHAPARQVWVSAMGRAYRLTWDADAAAFTLEGETLPVLLERLTRDFLHAP
jgi:frataxin-like iron-binding protein CyaY